MTLLLPTLLWLSLACTGGGAGDKTNPDGEEVAHWRWGRVGQVDGTPSAMAPVGDGLIAAIDEALWWSPDGMSWVDQDAPGLPDGRITFLAALPGAPDVRLAWVDGHGLYRSEGGDWQVVPSPPQSALLSALNPRVAPIPFDLDGDPDDADTAFMAATGGLFRTDDAGLSWTPVDLSEAGFNLLFTGVMVQGDTVIATAHRPAGVLPDEYAGLLTAGVFLSDDGGQSWQDLDPELATRAPVAATMDGAGRPWLATLDRGVLLLDQGQWLEMGGPDDPVDIAWTRGGIVAGSARRGVWRLEEARWTALGEDEPLVAMSKGHALGHQGSVWALEEGVGLPAPADGGAIVHVAISMHVNLYHSYRGDTNDDDGYGIDLDVMRRSLEWLDAEPALRADWDLDNAWSTDSEWMTVDGADVLAGIQARVAAGTDDVRLMSWNNGAMSAHTRAEFDESIARAWDSNLAAFGRVVPGVQPQENMFTPEHVGWYADQGIQWITLFHSMTPFSALPSEVELPQGTWTRPSTITTDAGSLTLVPVYHHGDLMDHGGLLGWVRQLHQSETEDQLLVVHFDADAESWEAFGQELAPLLDLDFVRFSTIQGFLDAFPPTVTVDTPMDVADGNGDGLQSWAEKDFNHELAASLAQARLLADHAQALAPDDDDVAALLEAAMEPRLLALSTTNYGLAAPTLHADRMASARGHVAQAQELAQAALDTADARAPVAAGTIEVRNVRPVAGTALVEVALPVEEGATPSVLDEDGAALPLVWQDGLARFALPLEPDQVRTLSWLPDGGTVKGVIDRSTIDLLPLATPFTECDGVQSLASADGQSTEEENQVVLRQVQSWSLPFCDGQGTVQVTREALAGLPGVIVQVQALMGSPSDPLQAESVALSPLSCDGDASSLTWQTFGGAVQTRPVRQDVRSWNGQSVDGWMSMTCADGLTVQVSHRATERSSLGLAPLRTSTSDAVLAPLGALWGPAPVVDARRLGGLGLAWHLSEAIGSQFRPQAPDWAGQTVSYRLLLGLGEVDPGTLDLFAHPPLVRVGR